MRAAPEDPPRNLTYLKGRQPLSGAQVGNLSPAFAEEVGVDRTSGVIVVRLRRQSIAGYVGFRPGDIVVEVEGRRVRTVKELEAALRAAEYGTWRFVIIRNGRRREFTLNL